MKDRDEEKRFTFSKIRNFLHDEIKCKERVEAVKARHGKAFYPKIPAVSTPSIVKNTVSPSQCFQQQSSVQKVSPQSMQQQVQTLQPRQQVEPSPIQQIQSPESAPAPELAFAPESAFATGPLLPQQRQLTVSIPFDPTNLSAFEMTSLAFISAFYQPSPLTPQRATYMAANISSVPTYEISPYAAFTYAITPDFTYISAAIPTFILRAAVILMNPKTFQAAVSGCIFYKKRIN